MATCCLFLAGKAEETPKKCRDLIRTVRQLTNDRQFETFGVDPREEIMALERVLLQVNLMDGFKASVGKVATTRNLKESIFSCDNDAW